MNSRLGILAALEQAQLSNGFVSGEDLASSLGISRAAVWKHISALKLGGYQIDGARARGYRLVAPPAALSESAIRSRLETRRIGRSILVLDVTRSTNSDAMALGREGAPEGSVVIAEEQTAGRGRLGRAWESSRGVNLYMSILLRPAIAPWKAPQLSLVAGIAAAEAVREHGVDARIKWPNDVVVVESRESGTGTDSVFSELESVPVPDSRCLSPVPALRKLAGILTEIEAEADRVAFVVVGIGLNMNSEAAHFSSELQGKATSLRIETGAPVDRAAVTARLLTRFEECYDAWSREGLAGIAPRWRALSVLDGRQVQVDAPGERYSGRCEGIDDDGALVLETAGGERRRVLAGDVTISAGYGASAPEHSRGVPAVHRTHDSKDSKETD